MVSPLETSRGNSGQSQLRLLHRQSGWIPPGAPHTDVTTPIIALSLHLPSAHLCGGLRNCSPHTGDGNLIFRCRMGRWLLEELVQRHHWEKETFFPHLWTDLLGSRIQKVCWWRTQFKFRNPNTLCSWLLIVGVQGWRAGLWVMSALR